MEFITNSLKRELVIDPAYDKTPKYGVHGVDMRWYIKGARGAIQFVLFTNWHLPHVEEKMDKRLDPQFSHLCCHPMPADIGYHSHVPMYPEQESMGRPCHVLGTEDCYYDGSGLNAKRFYDLLVREGGEALWLALEQEYRERFEPQEAAVAS